MLAASEKHVLSSVSWYDDTWLTVVAKFVDFFVKIKKKSHLSFEFT